MLPTEALKRIAIAGNVTALVALALLCANARVLFDPAPPAAQAPLPPVPAGEGAGRVVLVVVDGLRADVAADAAVMPHLAELARRGGRGTAVVDSLIPSTVAGVAALAGGVTPPPASFLNDFGARPAADGGVFAAVADGGGRSLVAGPKLWADLYGRWVHAAPAGDGQGDDDPARLAAAVGGLRGGGYRLVVLHLDRTDAAAHRHGGDSAEYRAAAAACDAGIGQLAAALGPGDAILVTADHGVTPAGGHGGPEPAVRQTPLVTAGPGLPRGAFGTVRQTDVGRLIRRALQLPPPPPPEITARASEAEPWAIFGFHRSPAPSDSPPRSRWTEGPPSSDARGRGEIAQFVLAILAVCAALAAAARVYAYVARPGACRRHAGLCLAFWPALLLVLVGWPRASLVGCVVTLAVYARASGQGGGRGLSPVPSPPSTGERELGAGRGTPRSQPGNSLPAAQSWIGGLFFAACAFGYVRLLDGILTSADLLPPAVGGVVALAILAAVVAAGIARRAERFGGRSRRWAVAIVAGGLAAWGLGHAPLAVAFGVAAAAGWGLGGWVAPRRATDVAHADDFAPRRAWVAGALAALLQTLPARWAGETCSLATLPVAGAFRFIDLPHGLALAAAAVFLAQGLVPLGFALGFAPRLAALRPAAAGGFAAGVGIGLAGQAVAAGIMLGASAAYPPVASIALGGLLRVLAETAYLFPAMALGVVLFSHAEDPGERETHPPAG